ncbi:MAG TPA: hypothetical protein PK986_08275 [Spirochaetota bacterium]|jgi:hypothetical protein|nr:hypothetical protein [Spirochaetota bacterium]
MITQEYKIGTNELKIETAESIEDAKKNKFDITKNEFSRFYVNGKIVNNYMLFVKYIVEESKKTNQSIVTDNKKVEELRMKMLKNQSDEMRNYLLSVRQQYGNAHVPESVMKELDDMIDKIDATTGARVVK